MALPLGQGGIDLDASLLIAKESVQHSTLVKIDDKLLQELVSHAQQKDDATPSKLRVSLATASSSVFLNNTPHPIKTLKRAGDILYKHTNKASRLTYESKTDLLSSKNNAFDEENDDALKALHSKLAQHKQQKEDNTTLITDKLLTGKGAKQDKTTLRKAIGSHRIGLFDGRARSGDRSVTATPLSGHSPALGPAATSKPKQPQTKSTIKVDSIRTAFLHLLAAATRTKKEIQEKLRCTAVDIEPLIDKYCREDRKDSRKLDLVDKAYKSLDIWKFNYPESDRSLARERAITAFDRLRLSRAEPEWQLLLPKEERGKGTCLTRLDLRAGALERAKTPTIRVEPASTDSVKEPGEVADPVTLPAAAETHALTRPDFETSSALQRQKLKDAQAKRLLAKDPKKAQQKLQKDTLNNQAKRDRTASPMAISRGVSPQVKTAKVNATTNSKVKSTEFVEDSSDDEMPDVLPPEPYRKQKGKPKEPKPTGTANGATLGLGIEMRDEPTKRANPSKSPSPAPPKTNERQTLDVPGKSEQVKVRGEQAIASLPAAVSAKETVPKPVKSTASPMWGKAKLNIRKETVYVTKTTTNSPRPSTPNPTSNGSGAKPPVKEHKRTASSPVKPSPLGLSPPTNASELSKTSIASSKTQTKSVNGVTEVRRTDHELQKSNTQSTGSLKRKADEQLNKAAEERPAKRPTHVSPPRSTTSSSSKLSIASNTFSHASDSSQTASSLDGGALSSTHLVNVQTFKTKQAKYSILRSKVEAMADPDPSTIESLYKLHDEVKRLKEDLWALQPAATDAVARG